MAVAPHRDINEPMLRITEQSGADGSFAVLRLEGTVAGRWVTELRRAFGAKHRADGQPVVIDLDKVSFIDSAGIEFFEEVASGVRIVNCSLFAAEQLKDVLARHQMVRR
jgi:anti-anti-sigma regulatory factor